MTNAKLWRAGLTAAVAATAIIGHAGYASAQTDTALTEQLILELKDMDAKQRESFQAAMRNAIQTPERGKEEVSLGISGQVTRNVLYVNDGERDGIYSVDNDQSSTRFRLVGLGRINEDVSAGTVFEAEFVSEGSFDSDVDLDDKSPDGADFNERKLELYFDSATFGRLWLGQGDTASDGTAEADLSGTGLVNATSNVASIAGGFNFATDGVASAFEIGDAFQAFDGLGRNDRIRYDTPTFVGTTFSTSFVNGDAFDFGVLHESTFGGTAITAGFGYANGGIGGSFDHQYSGSLAILLPFGLNFAVAGGTNDGPNDPYGLYGKVGYIFGFNALGDSAVSVDYSYDENTTSGDSEAQAVSFALNQNIDAAATEVYAGVAYFTLDQAGTDFDDIIAATAGARVKF